jgi:hypothetical protein
MAAVGGAGIGGSSTVTATSAAAPAATSTAATVAAPAAVSPAAVAVVDHAGAVTAATAEFIQMCAFSPAMFTAEQAIPDSVAALAPATDHDADPAACCRELLDLFGPDRSWRPSLVSLNRRSMRLLKNLLVSLPVYVVPHGLTHIHGSKEVIVYEHRATNSILKLCPCETHEDGFSLFMEVFLQVNVATMNGPHSTVAPRVLQIAKYQDPTSNRRYLAIVMMDCGPTLYSLIAKKPRLCTPAFFDEVFAGAEELLRVRCGGRVCHRDFHCGNITYPYAYSDGTPALSLPCLIDFGRATLDERFHTNLLSTSFVGEFDMFTLRASANNTLIDTLRRSKRDIPYSPYIPDMEQCVAHMDLEFQATPNLLAHLFKSKNAFSFADSYKVVPVLEATFDETPPGDALRVSEFEYVTALKLRYGTTSPYTGFPTFASLEEAAAAAAAASKPPSAWGADPRKQRGGQRGGQQRTQEQEQEPQGRGSLALGLLYLEREKTVGSNNKLQQIILDVAIEMLEEKEAMEATLLNASQEKTTPLNIFNKKKTQTRRANRSSRSRSRSSRSRSRRNRTRRHR